MEPKLDYLSLLAFIFCGFYLYSRFAALPSVVLYSDDASHTARWQSRYHAPPGTPGSEIVGRPLSANVPQNSIVLSAMKVNMRRTMQSRLQRARAYSAKAHEDFKAAQQYLTDPAKRGRFLTYQPPPGDLSYFMFGFATLIGCAKVNERIPVRMTKERRMDLFDSMDMGFIDRSVLFPNQTSSRFTVDEIGPGIFTAEFHHINTRFPDQAVALTGYGQSWKYFQNISAEIRSIFTFTQPIQLAAIDAILYGIRQLENLGLFCNTSAIPLRVGIHVHGDDIVQNETREHGHMVAPEEYLLRTALHIQRKYRHVVFFVLSNDVDYCRKLFREKNFVFVNGNAAEVDMAVMTFMDVMVLTRGSFGWWGAYLADAKEVFYYTERPSDFHKGAAPEDYFLPQWKGGN